MNFPAKDILSYLGRLFDYVCDGEELAECRKGRWPVTLIGHQAKNERLKVCVQSGRVLRFGTVSSSRREFAVRQLRVHEGRRRMPRCPMSNGMVGRYRRPDVA